MNVPQGFCDNNLVAVNALWALQLCLHSGCCTDRASIYPLCIVAIWLRKTFVHCVVTDLSNMCYHMGIVAQGTQMWS